MYKLYNFTTEEASKLLTQSYSTSFTMGIKTLHKSMRQPIYNIYGFVRVADEIVDTFHKQPQRELLDEFVNDTKQAIERGLSTNAILHSFQKTVNRYHIPYDLIDQFFKSMYLDLEDQKYDQELYEQYIVGSAEVVGLMCLCVFCEGDKEEYHKLEPAARRLGAVFQKVNFLRDLSYDFNELHRTYFPGIDFENLNNQDLKNIYTDIENDFNVALEGIKQLSDKARFGVYLAYTYYRKLFKKITQCSKEQLLTERIRIPNAKKYMLLAEAYLHHQQNNYQ